MNLFVAFS